MGAVFFQKKGQISVIDKDTINLELKKSHALFMLN